MITPTDRAVLGMLRDSMARHARSPRVNQKDNLRDLIADLKRTTEYFEKKQKDMADAEERASALHAVMVGL